MDIKDYLNKVNQMKKERIEEYSFDKKKDNSNETLFAIDRFNMRKTYQLNEDFSVDNINNFLSKIEKEEYPLFFNSHKIKQSKCTKIVGDDFEKIVYCSSKDCIVLMEPHQKKEISKEIEIIFEKVATQYSDLPITIGIYNSINEVTFKYLNII